MNMVNKFGGPGKVVACVSDSYNIFDAVDFWISKSEEIKASGTTLVIRPDSGDPLGILLTILDKFQNAGLMHFNEKGYRQLPNHFRLIQGDGVDYNSIVAILEELRIRNYSAANLAFGMGGALLQKVNRDTQKFAYKCSAVKVDGIWRDVCKDPITDPGKSSKRGLLDLVGSISEGFSTQYITDVGHPLWNSALQTVYDHGIKEKTKTTLDSIRHLTDIAIGHLENYE